MTPSSADKNYFMSPDGANTFAFEGICIFDTSFDDNASEIILPRFEEKYQFH
jgi:hypothetical protein